jgi:4-amino-4-deoxy-L-arabinose transferase-like glycosyltransferase
MRDITSFRLVFLLVLTITLLRIVILIASPLDLYPDEAQYWWWAQTPDIGYFSKPPLIAWVIRATTFLFGDREWSIRLAMPIFHAGTALLVFAIARFAYPVETRVAGFGAIGYLTLPGVSYSSGIASTDAPLLFFWALALFAFLKTIEKNQWRWPLLCGAALGLGLLTQYAMLYFALGIMLAAVPSPEIRRRLLSVRGGLIFGTAVLAFLPNVLWNAAHGFPTVANIVANAEWGNRHFNALKFAGFMLGQAGVFGPIWMAAWFVALWRVAGDRGRQMADILLGVLSLLPLFLIAIQAFVAGANANWAETAYVAAIPLAIREIMTWRRASPLWTSLALHGAVFVVVGIVLTRPATADLFGFGNALKREEGWRVLGQNAIREADRGRYPIVVSDNRSVVAELLYYARPRDFAIRTWDPDRESRNHFQMTLRLAAPAPRVLLIVAPDHAPSILPTFESVRLIRTEATPVAGHYLRVFRFYDARGYRGPRSHA